MDTARIDTTVLDRKCQNIMHNTNVLVPPRIQRRRAVMSQRHHYTQLPDGVC